MPSPHSPFPDFDFNYDPSLFPNAPPMPASADLFSPTETSDLFGFLDTFGWDDGQPQYSSPRAPYSNPHLHTVPEPSTSTRPRRATTRTRTRSASVAVPPRDSHTPSNASESSTNDSSSNNPPPPPQAPPTVSLARSDSTGSANAKPLLSTPQKRLNHIMSEQKRRNAIRDGYAQLIAILAPAGSTGIGMPQRGRPKGSGSRGKGQSKGKSGVLFRAVEYIKWLEEGSDAMRAEVMRVESAAGIQVQER
ncbi:hypothetical protein C8F01DRAFT_507945 [Mycena amicta]|nr:hypothetical protein C8F01DRAFT_507945 [Mycena amicta]